MLRGRKKPATEPRQHRVGTNERDPRVGEAKGGGFLVFSVLDRLFLMLLFVTMYFATATMDHAARTPAPGPLEPVQLYHCQLAKSSIASRISRL